jgi:hypothetical protein
VWPAIDHYQHALTLHCELGDRHGQAEGLRDLGDALLRVGHRERTRQVWQEALELCEALPIPKLTRSVVGRGPYLLTLGSGKRLEYC